MHRCCDWVPSARVPERQALSAKRDWVPSQPSAQQASSAQRPKINSNQTKGWSQAIAARPVELEKEIWFKKKILKWVWLNFVSDERIKFNPNPILKSFLKPNFLFKIHRTGGNSLRPPFGLIWIDFGSLGTRWPLGTRSPWALGP